MHGNVCGVTRKLPWREVRPLNHVLYHIQGLSSALQCEHHHLAKTAHKRTAQRGAGCARRTGTRCTCASSTLAASTARRRATTPPPAASAPGPPCRPMTGAHSDSSGPGCQQMWCLAHVRIACRPAPPSGLLLALLSTPACRSRLITVTGSKYENAPHVSVMPALLLSKQG